MSETSSSRDARPTLADVLAAIKTADLPDRRRQDMASAVRTVCRLLGRTPGEVPLDGAALGRRLERVAPEAAGLRRASWNNLRSLFRAAFGLVELLPKGRSCEPMSEAWRRLFEALETKADRVRLSRLLRWLSSRRVGPDAVTHEVLETFHRELLDDPLLTEREARWKDCVWAWNRAVSKVPNWPALRIERASRRDVYTLPWSTFPADLKADVDAWLDRLACRDLADDGPIRAVRPSTLDTREYQLRAFASALVARGRAPESLRCLADLVAMEAFTEGLRFHYERRGRSSSTAIHGLASMLKSVARHWVKVDDATLKRLDAITRKLAVPQDGLTEKNRERLRPLDDPAAVIRLVTLPQMLRKEADKGRLPARRAAVLAQISVAVELLLMAPIRRKNLAALDLEAHFVTVGSGLHLVLSADDVKNRNPLEFALPDETVELIRWYCERHRPVLAHPAETALFPGEKGGGKRGATLGNQISAVVFRCTGLKIHTHLFRHAGAKIYLDRNPGSYEVVRRVLGHKKMDTTTRFYAGQETAAATRHFDAAILSLRASAAPALAHRNDRRRAS